MTDLERILPLWQELESAAKDYVLATVVEVQGSSYRKPGACMLLASDGRRAGTVSGGCLEAHVARRAWWHTTNGPTIQRYSTAEEDGELPFGSGCGGVVYLLLERPETARPLLSALQQAFDRRTPLAVATILEGPELGRRAFAGLDLASDSLSSQEPSPAFMPHPATEASLQALAEQSLACRKSVEKDISIQGAATRTWANFRPARPGLWIFGAGDDALPLLRLAKELGWYVSIADGRSHLAIRERFPLADELRVLPMRAPQDGEPASPLPDLAGIRPGDAAVLMTHSFEQDARILASLLAMDTQPAYIGVLGPQRRTRELLAESRSLLHLPANSDQEERWLAQLHAPMGLDLGAESPETIALSIVAEIQQSITAATALPLRKVRAAALSVTF